MVQRERLQGTICPCRATVETDGDRIFLIRKPRGTNGRYPFDPETLVSFFLKKVGAIVMAVDVRLADAEPEKADLPEERVGL